MLVAKKRGKLLSLKKRITTQRIVTTDCSNTLSHDEKINNGNVWLCKGHQPLR